MVTPAKQQEGTPLRVLLVEDSENDALLLVDELRRGGYDPVWRRVQTAEALERELAGSASWDVILSDYSMPRFSAPEALEVARRSCSDAPFIVVSGRVGEEAAVEALKAGAHDYVMKDNLARLCATVERGSKESKDRRRREAILDAVRLAAERFLSDPAGWERGIDEVLARLGEAAEVSRVYVFENHVGADGMLWNRQRHKWQAPEAPQGLATGPDGVPVMDFPYRDGGPGRWTDFSRWEEALGRGVPLHGNTREFPDHEREFLAGQLGILSMILVPIFVEEAWWGFIGFDDCEAEREWSAAEVDALKAAASTLGAAIERGIMEEELGRRDAVLDAVRFASDRLLGGTADWGRSVRGILRRLGEAMGAERVYIYENFVGADGELWNVQRHEWTAPGVEPGAGGGTAADAGLAYTAGGYGRWMEILGRGEAVYGHTRDFPEGEQWALREQGIVSIAVFPIFTAGKWWGFIGFDECSEERVWSASEMGALGAAAGTLGAAIKRREVEEELRGSEERYRAVVEQATDGLYLLDAQTRRIIETNPSFQRMLGYSAGDLQGMEVYDFVGHPRKDVEATLRSTLRRKRRVVGDRRYRRSDGTLVDVEVGVSVISYGGREVVCTIVRDVTERKRAEKALASSENRLRTIIETEPECVKVLGMDGALLEMNPAGLAMIEADSLEQVRGRSVYDYIAPEHRRNFVELTETVLRGGSGTLEFELVGLKGTRSWLDTHAVPLRDARGEVTGLLAITRNVTERKESERKLEEAEFRYRMLVEQVPAVIYIQLPEPNNEAPYSVAYMSPQIERILGHPPRAFAEDPAFWGGLVHPDDWDGMIAENERSDVAGGPFDLEYRLLHRDGTYRWIRDEAVLVRDEAGDPLYWQGVLSDVTGRKRAEEDLRRHDAILEAVRFAAERFLAETDWQISIGEVLARLGSATGVSRVYVFEKRVDEDGELWDTQLHEWTAEGVSSQMGNPLMQAMHYEAAGFGRWARLFARGEPVHGHTRDLPPEEQAEMRKQGVLSLLEVPIFVAGEWWGQIGFDDCAVEREWSAAEMDAIGAAANTLGAAIQRRRIEEELRGSEERYRAVIEQATENIFLVDIETRRVVESNPAFRETLGYPEEELNRLTLYDVVADDRENVDENVRRVLEQVSPNVGERRYRRKDGSLLDVEVSASIILRDGRETLCAVAHDITERRRAQELLEERVAALSRVAANLALELPTEDALDVLAESTVNASTAVACGIVLVGETGDNANLFGSHGLPEGYTSGLQRSYREGAQSPTLQAFRTQEPVLVHDLRKELLDDPHYAPIHPFVREAPWDIVYSLPLVSRGRALGGIFFCFLPNGEPGEDERVFLRAVADQAAVAVENARLFAEARGKAALEERQRLARELHDSVSQALYGIALGARTSRTLLERDPQKAAGPLDYVLSLSEAGLAEMRALIFELRPESLEAEGLMAALEKQAAALRARHEIPVEADLCPEPGASLDEKEAVYRIAQEALHNVVKHARAGSVGLRVRCATEEITLQVADDGAGFDPTGDFPGHLGLRSMRERASRLGGTLDVESAPGKGTTITARIPLRT